MDYLNSVKFIKPWVQMLNIEELKFWGFLLLSFLFFFFSQFSGEENGGDRVTPGDLEGGQP